VLNEPAWAGDTKSIVDERVTAVMREQGVKESIQIEWRGSPKSLPVITMPLDLLLYNPETHRIRAQRDFDTQRDKHIVDNPWGEEAQAYLDYLLSSLPIDPSKPDPAFEKLMEDLAEYGQKDPGIITPSGILINGNSRRAALRRTKASNMRVAVLPDDVRWEDIAEVELELQMRRDLKRDYSFVNNLLALDEAVRKFGPDTAAKAFRLQQPTLQKWIWILDQLKDLVARSTSSSGVSLNLRDFEEDQGKLEELYRAYRNLAKSDRDAAELLRETRLLGVVLDKSKTDIRIIEPEFLDTYLTKQLPADLPTTTTSQRDEIPGLGRSIAPSSDALSKARDLVTVAASARAEDSHGDDPKSSELLGAMKESMESALRTAGKNVRLKKSQQAAIDRINDAADSLDGSIHDMVEAKSKRGLDENALNDALDNLRQALGRFSVAVSRTVSLSDEDSKWVAGVAELTND
jgi:hypothetical protein